MAKKNERPWGSYTNLRTHPGTLVKEMVVQPGHRMSLQSHEHREEYWFGVSGEGIAYIGDSPYVIAPGVMNWVPQHAIHRICNKHGTEPLVMIEVQIGEILSEDDITRYHDDYARVDNN